MGYTAHGVLVVIGLGKDTFSRMEITERLLGLLLTHRYQVTDHALESMDEDHLTLSDIICGVGTGRVRRSWPRVRKYEIAGRAIDGRALRIVMRLIEARLVRIITVYEER
jgi:hypothetical protein